MSRSTISAASPARGLPPAPRQAQLNILFVGPETAPFHAAARSAGRTAWAESFVEAILMSGQETPYQLILAGIAQEFAQLERAVTSLRSVNPHARLVLLTEPAGEPLCRRALSWGADDYHILPVAVAELLQRETAALLGPRETASARVAPADLLGAAGQIPLLHLPVVVQVALMDALLQSRTDFPQRALTILETYTRWPGRLRFAPALEQPVVPSDVPAPEEIKNRKPEIENSPPLTLPVTHGPTTFGALTLDAPSFTPEDRSRLDQAAAWLAGWLALGRRQEQLRTLAITDELSGAYNRRYFHRFVTNLLERARVHRFRVSLLLFDIDNFKSYNDQFGHAAGDSIIRNLILLLRRCTRPNDLVARIGGDEFAVVFWDSEAPRQPNSEHPRDAVAATERFRKAILAHDWCAECHIQGQVSVSGGIATFPWNSDSFESLLATADAALLRAKAAGKNVIRLHEPAAKVT